MTLRELLQNLGLLDAARDHPLLQNKMLDFELVVHEAGEPADEVVNCSAVYEVKSIYLEYN